MFAETVQALINTQKRLSCDFMFICEITACGQCIEEPLHHLEAGSKILKKKKKEKEKATLYTWKPVKVNDLARFQWDVSVLKNFPLEEFQVYSSGNEILHGLEPVSLKLSCSG